ncbi:hypothetical protein CF394_00720 [Tetzosporium hominis]|uniref:Uncharacterized protein n=1 Tax=Tetzosporium hominis TaxID=2020506 RepID=A0A264W7A0_9BACL|nr:hypothetical protein [Tetzosporium hominis]OZS79460.1 hypothetical protein CF394_00720 [Tetzosporium hominis]
MSRRKDLNKKRMAIIKEMNELSHQRCEKCRAGAKVKSSELDCCDASKRTVELGKELLRLKGREIVPFDDEVESKKDRKPVMDHSKYKEIAEMNGICYSTYVSRVNNGIPMDVAATYTTEGIREWRKRHDKQSSASGETH